MTATSNCSIMKSKLKVPAFWPVINDEHQKDLVIHYFTF